jgi:hypothetical protein
MRTLLSWLLHHFDMWSTFLLSDQQVFPAQAVLSLTQTWNSSFSKEPLLFLAKKSF